MEFSILKVRYREMCWPNISKVGLKDNGISKMRHYCWKALSLVAIYLTSSGASTNSSTWEKDLQWYAGQYRRRHSFSYPNPKLFRTLNGKAVHRTTCCHISSTCEYHSIQTSEIFWVMPDNIHSTCCELLFYRRCSLLLYLSENSR